MVDMTDYSKKPIGLKWRSNTPFILSTITIGMFTDLFLYGIIVPILPFILKDRLSIPHSQIQTYTSILLACHAGASVVFSIPAGIIADKLPARQLPFLFGLVALLAGTLLLALGQSIKVLILARILQGASGAVIWTIGMALIMDTVGSSKLGVTIGSIFGFISVGELAAPILGGVVYKEAGNGAVFAMGFGLLAIDFMMRLFLIEKKVANRYGLDDVQENDAEDFGQEAREDSPVLSNSKSEQWNIPENHSWIVRKMPILYCLSNSRVLTAQAVTFMQATLLAVFNATIPTEAQDLFGFDSLKAGLLFIALVTPYLILGPIAGKGGKNGTLSQNKMKRTNL
jgi:MFS family permease